MLTQKLLVIFILCFVNCSLIAQDYPAMQFVMGGTFMMGNEYKEGNEDELPFHKVTLKSFKIAKSETTVAQWKIYCLATAKQMPKEPSWRWKDDQPIVNISWFEAVEYCEWLSEKTGSIYRLPTEAEWEFAARGGTKSHGFKYSGGQTMETLGWCDTKVRGTHAVAQKNPNELGIYDMSGNAWEWCNDWYGTYQLSDSTNPTGPTMGNYRILRGGSWLNEASYCRVSYRRNHTPDFRDTNIGFRVVSAD